MNDIRNIKEQMCRHKYARLSRNQQLACRKKGRCHKKLKCYAYGKTGPLRAATAIKERTKKKHKMSRSTARQEQAGQALAKPASILRTEETSPHKSKKYGNELGH